MGYHVPEKLNADLHLPAMVHTPAQPWTPSLQPGVERRFLERDGGEVARASSLVRYVAGSAFPVHRHARGEEYLVLEGVFSDEHGDFPAGSYVRNPPGSRHAPFTRKGCTIFVKLCQMTAADRDTLVVRPGDRAALPGAVPGITRIALFDGADGESVGLETLAQGTAWDGPRLLAGEEILVLEGWLSYGEADCPAGTWLRMPAGEEKAMASVSGCRLWVKRGHLDGMAAGT